MRCFQTHSAKTGTVGFSLLMTETHSAKTGTVGFSFSLSMTETHFSQKPKSHFYL